MAANTHMKRNQRPKVTASSVQTSTRQGQQNVFARLQGLFPTTPSLGNPINVPRSIQQDGTLPSPPIEPKALKVRILTWNMHDSLPKGDLEELLGKVPLWTSSNTTKTDAFPNLSVDESHPYHLVVVAGQECPSLSGIPMGLGAGFKLIDKDRDKDKDKDRERDKEGVREYDKLRSRHRDKDDHGKSREDPFHDGPSGWTSMIEDWLCHGGGAGFRTSSPTVADVGFPKPLSPRLLPKEPRKGPYQLLIKERMMGIYLAIYIHRELRPLVRGTSRSAVTAGLIGGRVGNKGGVGITLNIDGTTLLFLNAHLAAHEGKVHHRLANLAKIKAELSVDDFLENDDPRVMAEDLTDKFDYTFICGDLNFRLDISRLHADWLVSRKEYSQALAFDQLKKLMENGEAFVGFQEGPIDFPPTFKYDVLRTIKGAKRRKSKLDRRKHLEDKASRLTEIEERELAELEIEEAEEEGEREGEEAASMGSSIWTSIHSKVGTERGIDDDDDYFHASPSTQTMSTSTSKLSLAATAAAHKAKAKWLSLLSPSSVPSPTKLLQTVRTEPSVKKSHSVASSVDVVPREPLIPTQAGRALSLDAVDKTLQPPPPMIFVSSTKSSAPSDGEDEDEDRGVYDSSHKKRVPSWCDRILWKSTVVPDPEPEEEEPLEPFQRPKNRVGQFFANALNFRPLSARTRRDSVASTATTSTYATAISHDETSSSMSDVLNPNGPLSRFAVPPARLEKLSHSKSIENLPTKSPTRADPRDTDAGRRRSNSVTSSSRPPPLHFETTRRATASAALPTAPVISPIIPSKDHTPTSSFRWRFLPSFLSHTSSVTQSSASIPLGSAEIPPALPRKGEVVCLAYNTLDDRGMRRLEGRSDHRPVIGSYAIYL